MCGIAGYYCTHDYDPRLAVALPLLGLYMETRGRHSWGITNGSEVTKNKGAFSDSFSGEFQGDKTVLLHTRFGTTGALTAENSHPFLIKGILGVHNGQVYNHSSIGKKYDIKYEVDSEVIYHRIADGGDLSEVQAYGALVFFQDGKLHIGKFNDGQMSLVKCTWGWMWASTKDALDHSLNMAGLLATAEWDVNLKQGRLYRLDGDVIAKDPRKLNFSKEKWTYTPSTAVTTYSSGYRSTVPVDWWRGKSWDSTRKGWIDEKTGDFYASYGDEHPVRSKDTPLPTAETTTFKPVQENLLNEPESDYDEAVDTRDASDDAYFMAELDEKSKCAGCDNPLPSDGYVILNRKRVCADCYKEYAEHMLSGLDDDKDAPPEPEYHFDEYDEIGLWEEFHDVQMYYCSECGEWADGDKIYVAKEDPQHVHCCKLCYEHNFLDLTDDDDEDENEERCSSHLDNDGKMLQCVKPRFHTDDCAFDPQDESGVEHEADGTGTTASTEPCSTYERSVGTGITRHCIRSKGHEGSCIDAHGEMIWDPLPV